MRIELTIVRKLIVFFLLLSAKNIFAQQHTLFSHYNFDHFMYNPAAAGYTNSLTANFFHRDQWTGFDLAPRTQFLDIHAPMRTQPFALGGHIYNDNSGHLNNIRFQGAAAYQFIINETGNLGIGLGLNFQRLQLRNERGGINLNPSQTIDDPLINQYQNSVWNFFLTPGIYYNNGNFYGGISSMQILQSDFNINEANANTEVSRRHWMLMAGYNYQLNKKWHINPSLLLRTEKASPLNFDINAAITYTDLVWLNLGFRSSKMFMIGVGINIDKMFRGGYNFDAYLNPLGALKARGSHEIYLGFTSKLENDLDNDGIIDRLDKCPTIKGIAKYNGCPYKDSDKTKTNDKLKDSDKDGTPDSKDECPNVPGSRRNDGCPEVFVKDSDGDGINDNEDNCPNIAGLKSNNGCPEVELDTDGDGIVDKEDKCPDVPGIKSNSGCPEIIEKIVADTDGDGIVDEEDKCPDVPGVKSNSGCPEIIEKIVVDTDGDGIFDDKDECPNTFGIAARDGCPDLDSDGDGILDLDDGCPNTAGDESNNGCPLKDRDNDGIADVDDLCPDAFGFARNDGCPDAPKPIDSDGDGVIDEKDECPDVYGEDNGCPKPSAPEPKPEILDSDGDGIADNEDDCPYVYGASSNNGCPVAVQSDSDGDGIVDTLDECPYVYGAASNYGCPSETSTTNDAYKNILDAATRNLRFGTGSSNIEYSSFITLKDLAKLMINNPGFRLRIVGHTDNVGNSAANMELSKKRAEAVRNYLLNEGVSFGNMIVEYFGGSKPIADNNTAEGRRLNRRVDFELIEY